MSIFSREGSKPSNPPAPSHHEPSPAGRPPAAKATLIAAGTEVHGEVSGGTDLMVEGHLEGRVELDATLVVGREGRVQGQIQARVVRVDGKVHGNIRAQERVEVTPSGSLEGDIAAARVVIAEGAFFKGNVEMGGGMEAREEPSKPLKGSGGSKNQGRSKQADSGQGRPSQASLAESAGGGR